MPLSRKDYSVSNRLMLLAKQAVEGFISGLHKSPYQGFSVEFAEHRAYNVGESVKHIDWRLYARTDKLFSKKYEEETNLRALIVLDNSSSMYYPQEGESKLGSSVICAAGLLYLLQKQQDAFGLCFFHQKIENQTPIKSSPEHLFYLMELLEKELTIENKPFFKTNIHHVLHQIAETTSKGSLVVLFSDFLQNSEEEIFSALGHLRFNRHEIIVFHVYDQSTEKSFSFQNRPYTFEDLESGEKIKLEPDSIREAIELETDLQHRNLKEKCAKLGIDYVPINLENPIPQVLTTFLQKRTKIKG